MDKLIELLNEYDEGGNWRKLHWKGLGCEDYDTIGYKDKGLTCEQDEIISYLISKSYGFIKSLVENDKIDYKKLHGEEWYLPLVDIAKFDGSKRLEVLLMLLAIQDEPLEFLINILK